MEWVEWAGRAPLTRLALRWWTYDRHKSVDLVSQARCVVVVDGKKDRAV